MISENLVEIMGYLADDPVIRKTMDGKPVCNFTVGVNRSENVTDWIDCVTWEKSAEFMNAHAHKGKPSIFMTEGHGKTVKVRWVN